MKKKRREVCWRRESAFHLSVISAAAQGRAGWDHANASLWRRCTGQLTGASRTWQPGREPPPEWRPRFDRLMIQPRTELRTSTRVQ